MNFGELNEFPSLAEFPEKDALIDVHQNNETHPILIWDRSVCVMLLMSWSLLHFKLYTTKWVKCPNWHTWKFIYQRIACVSWNTRRVFLRLSTYVFCLYNVHAYTCWLQVLWFIRLPWFIPLQSRIRDQRWWYVPSAVPSWTKFSPQSLRVLTQVYEFCVHSVFLFDIPPDDISPCGESSPSELTAYLRW